MKLVKSKSFSLKQSQTKLWEWQCDQFGVSHESGMHFALGMSEEVGEVCHTILKAHQGIREGANGLDLTQLADDVADVFIYGMQLLSFYDIDAETEIEKVIQKVTKRDWKNNPKGDGY